METKTFFSRPVGTTGCEISNQDGVIAWTVDSVWAALIVDLLNEANDSEASHGGTLPHCQGNSKRK